MSHPDSPDKLARGAPIAFLHSFGERTLDLACHAAVPVVLNPELLHLLRINFFLDNTESLSYTAESDILLSPLCQEIGDDLYEIPRDIRDVLLRKLATAPNYGERRIREIAALLLQYNERFSPWKNNQALERGQQLTALSFLDAEGARNWLEESEIEVHSAALSEREWFVAMRAELLKLNTVLNAPQDKETSITSNLEDLGDVDSSLQPSASISAPEPALPFPFGQAESPFPLRQQPFSRYEPIEREIEQIRVLVVDSLLRDEDDISAVARAEWQNRTTTHLKQERQIASLALQNIVTNVARLVKEPTTQITHVSELVSAEKEFKPNAIVLSGTLRDFDYYKPSLIEDFGKFIRATTTPVLAIAGGHHLVGMSFGARVITLDRQEPSARRHDRVVEYQYRFLRIEDPEDPIFQGIDNAESHVWQEYTREARILRVWQNHSLQLDRVPDGFRLLARSYLCNNQMMVKRSDNQLIYSVQFHLEKSFEDWNSNPTRWDHPNESRDGRVLFNNFLKLALKHGR